jgi:hypothetical protein
VAKPRNTNTQIYPTIDVTQTHSNDTSTALTTEITINPGLVNVEDPTLDTSSPTPKTEMTIDSGLGNVADPALETSSSAPTTEMTMNPDLGHDHDHTLHTSSPTPTTVMVTNPGLDKVVETESLDADPVGEISLQNQFFKSIPSFTPTSAPQTLSPAHHTPSASTSKPTTGPLHPSQRRHPGIQKHSSLQHVLLISDVSNPRSSKHLPKE